MNHYEEKDAGPVPSGCSGHDRIVVGGVFPVDHSMPTHLEMSATWQSLAPSPVFSLGVPLFPPPSSAVPGGHASVSLHELQ